MKSTFGTSDDRRARHAAILHPAAEPDVEDRHRRQLGHDIDHELSTIVLLASSVLASVDAGDDARRLASQIVEEARWLGGLVRMFDAVPATGPESAGGRTRIDQVAASVIEPVCLSRRTEVTLEASPVSAVVSRLGLWRALRNVVLNALAAAGVDGRILVRVRSESGQAVIEVEDDGPGCDPQEARRSALGLAIVNEFVVQSGGRLSIRVGSLGGALVRLELPAAV